MIEKFLEYLKSEKRYSELTIKAYQKDLECFYDYINDILNKKIAQVSKKDIRNYMVFLSEKGKKPQTINREISALKTYFKFLEYIGEVESRPTSSIKSLKTQKKISIPLSIKEMDKLLDRELFSNDWVGDRDYLVLQLLYETGIRRAELIGLDFKDIDFSQKQIKVLGKRNKERIIPVRDDILLSIKKLREKSPFSEIMEAIFTTEKGKRIYPKLVYNVVSSYLRLVTNKKKVSPHILRHSFATGMLNNGADINVVKELLGHSSLASTQVYTHNDIGQLKKVFNQSHPRETKK
ncbi:tyrosine-type recombinase/integrase [Weeksellaceae bacterium TAE3-ERU29]|nr:tyrosine-type recombinase/integrase [Weeksellaceae bacterium TAE3-ERU29]